MDTKDTIKYLAEIRNAPDTGISYDGKMALSEAIRLLATNSPPTPAPSLRDGEPCGHPGCLSHRSHPCEGCGRIGGRTPAPAPSLDDMVPRSRLAAVEDELDEAKNKLAVVQNAARLEIERLQAALAGQQGEGADKLAFWLGASISVIRESLTGMWHHISHDERKAKWDGDFTKFAICTLLGRELHPNKAALRGGE